MLQWQVEHRAQLCMADRKFHRGFIEPTIIADVSDDMNVFRDEVFGPVAPLTDAGNFAIV